MGCWPLEPPAGGIALFQELGYGVHAALFWRAQAWDGMLAAIQGARAGTRCCMLQLRH